MFGLSFTHLIILAVLVLIFIGPEQLPEVARTFARLLNEWRRASSEIQSSLANTLKDDFTSRVNTPPTPPPPIPATTPAEEQLGSVEGDDPTRPKA